MAGSVLLSGCRPDNRQKSDSIIDGQGEMTLRTNPNTGDKVSLLGYGMMRLPVEAGGTMRENPDSPIDQEMVNRQVDYALEHGVNYFDTAPVYCQGKSEHSTGIALARHPRNSYFIATKMSNFAPASWNRADSEAIFENSLKELQTDYVDLLLIHQAYGDVFGTWCRFFKAVHHHMQSSVCPGPFLRPCLYSQDSLPGKRQGMEESFLR